MTFQRVWKRKTTAQREAAKQPKERERPYSLLNAPASSLWAYAMELGVILDNQNASPAEQLERLVLVTRAKLLNMCTTLANDYKRCCQPSASTMRSIGSLLKVMGYLGDVPHGLGLSSLRAFLRTHVRKLDQWLDERNIIPYQID